MHVGGGAHLVPVERDDGDRVEALEYQIHPIGTLGEKIELESVLPHRVGDPMLASFVVVEIRISDEPGGEQVEVDATRAGGRQLEDLLRSASDAEIRRSPSHRSERLLPDDDRSFLRRSVGRSGPAQPSTTTTVPVIFGWSVQTYG